MEQKTRIIGMLLFDNLTQLDLTGPFEVFARLPNTKVLLIADKKRGVISDSGMKIYADTSYRNCPPLDILCVPGGPGVGDAMTHKTTLNFLKKQTKTAEYVTSVCTGALVLAAAGILRGYHATTHWLSLDLLALFPDIIVENQRVVIDRNRITGGGVTAGIDFGLTIAAKLYGENIAKEIQLMMEYNPQPPFNCGSPETTDKAIIEAAMPKWEIIRQKRRAIIEDILQKIVHLPIKSIHNVKVSQA
jgi:cyclohexyl-isocyanide hydratase